MLGIAIGLVVIAGVLGLFAGPWLDFQWHVMAEFLHANVSRALLRTVDIAVGVVSLLGASAVLAWWFVS